MRSITPKGQSRENMIEFDEADEVVSMRSYHAKGSVTRIIAVYPVIGGLTFQCALSRQRVSHDYVSPELEDLRDKVSMRSITPKGQSRA